MKFEKADINHFDEINNLHNQAFPLDPLTNLKSELHSINDKYFIVKLDNLVGYISFKCVIDECDMIYFAVDKNYQNQQIGSELIKFAVSELIKDNIKVITLEVRSSNLNAISVYEKIGFKQISIRKNYYTDPKEDGLIYRWEGKTT